MPNRLANETSPYLLQHQNNPVDWYPWGEEALARSKAEGKPIFLSIGYSACHWCHVMEHESFENEEIAKFLNEHFVCIKVDREERPDLDQIYMNAVQIMTGRGGWPMSVFLTPELKPFYGGTYWPPTAGRGMPGFDQVTTAVHDAWANRRDQVDQTAADLTERLQAVNESQPGGAKLSLAMLTGAGKQLENSFDRTHGGFGAAPKFPHSMDVQLLLRLHHRDDRQAWLDIARLTLDKMAAGGMYDQLGGGFHRYSVDERWLVPHFEKMLYDNALLASAYLDAWLVTGDANYQRVVRETLDYILRDMTDPAGGFYSTEDADSPPFPGAGEPGGPNEEGLFFTWKPDEIRGVLGEELADTFCRVYDVSPIGNFEGRSILNLPKSIPQQAKLLDRDESKLIADLATAREQLLVARGARPRPGLDNKVLVNWNGLMIDALARAGAALDEPRYTTAAKKAADFILAEMQPTPGRLLHSWRSGVAKLAGYLDDYTALANGLISLYEATFEANYLQAAATLLDSVLTKFNDPAAGGFFYTADDHEQLITRNKELTDNATPSGNSLAATALVRLGKVTGESKYLDAAHATLAECGDLFERIPMAMGQMLMALDLQLGPTPELVLAGDSDGNVAKQIHQRFLPRRVLASADWQPPKILEATTNGKQAINDQPTLYVCENHTCGPPAVGAEAIRQAIEEL